MWFSINHIFKFHIIFPQPMFSCWKISINNMSFSTNQYFNNCWNISRNDMLLHCTAESGYTRLLPLNIFVIVVNKSSWQINDNRDWWYVRWNQSYCFLHRPSAGNTCYATIKSCYHTLTSSSAVALNHWLTLRAEHKNQPWPVQSKADVFTSTGKQKTLRLQNVPRNNKNSYNANSQYLRNKCF